jgi:NADH-quinone oxidoreductase subunit C
MTALAFDAIAARLRAGVAAAEPQRSENGQDFVRLPAAAVPAAARLLRDDPALRFDALMDLCGYDRLLLPVVPKSTAIAVVYLLWSHVHRHRLTIEVLAERAHAEVPSVGDVWPAAINFEREVFDLLGVTFTGHPSLQRILCPDDWVGHPLRKDYLYPSEYHGVPHLRQGQHFESGPRRVGDPEPAPAAPAAAGKPVAPKGAQP